ncbi:ribonuclease H-like domain-containing protein [Tanacetum coccineum]
MTGETPTPPTSLVDKSFPSIKHIFPIELSLEEHNYTSWSTLFHGHYDAYNVLGVIDGTMTSTTTTTINKKDSLLKMWICSTLSLSLLKCVLKPTSNAKDVYRTRQLLLRCDSTRELYHVQDTSHCHLPIAFLSSSHSTWHIRLGYPSEDVLHVLVSNHSISCNKPKESSLCHACQLGKHECLPFHNSEVIIESTFDIIHSDFWTSPISSLGGTYIIGLFLLHAKYAEDVLGRAHMKRCNPCRTPVDIDSKLGPEGPAISDPTLYRTLAGALQYLRGTTDFGLQFFASFVNQLTAYFDADWAGFPAIRKSTFGYGVFLGDNLLSWSSKKQETLSRSSADAEYKGVSNAVAETAWVRNLLRELYVPLLLPQWSIVIT